jgi:uncharacterized membrane protein
VERINNRGSWIGGGCNQTAMLEVLELAKACLHLNDRKDVQKNLWMGFYFMELKIKDKIDKWPKADNSPL